jgi:hypothetical protein
MEASVVTALAPRPSGLVRVQVPPSPLPRRPQPAHPIAPSLHPPRNQLLANACIAASRVASNPALDAALPGRRGRPTIPKACFGFGKRCTARSGRRSLRPRLLRTARDFPSSTVVVDQYGPAPLTRLSAAGAPARAIASPPIALPILGRTDLVQIELDRCGGFCRFHIRSLDRPQNFALGAQ